MTDFLEIKHLVNLFEECNKYNKDEDQDDDDEEVLKESNEQKKIGPNNIGNKEQKLDKTKVNPYNKIEPKARESREVTDPFDETEFLDEIKEDQSRCDWKQTPKWDISYRQQVSASDVFLGMGLKTPSTSSCEEMILKISLPEESRQNMDLKILKNKLTLNSPRFYLDLDLPHPVDPKKGNARYDKDGQTLVVTLIMDRELDALNF